MAKKSNGPTKLGQCLDILRNPDRESESNVGIAEEIGCSEAHVRRARLILEAERTSVPSEEQFDESARLLADIIAADEAEELAARALEEAKSEVKELAAKLKEFTRAKADRIRAVREEHPLFDDQPTSESRQYQQSA